MEKQQPTNRLLRSLPKIGIRPTIDGRYGGVRESLEDQVMGMAKRTADFLSENLKHACGLPVECVIADRAIGGVAEAARCDELFEREGAKVSITVTPAWCYGFETFDMDPQRPKAIWGFNGTERPGAVYLAAALSGYAQKGLPTFGIYGREVQDSGETTIPPDVQEQLLRFARAGIAATTMRGNSYLAIGGVSMGIAGSEVDSHFFENYLGMRVEYVDMVEMRMRMDRGLYDEEEFKKARKWVKENCPEGQDPNPKDKQRSRKQKDQDWDDSIKMALIARDLMIGNPKLEKIADPEMAQGHNAIAGGFQGQRQWTDYNPNGDFMEAILTTSFDWNGIRQPFAFATENDALNGVSMLFGHLLSGRAMLFSDVRTFWSPESVKRVTGHTLTGKSSDGIIHLINSGPSALDWTGEQSEDDKNMLKPWWDVTPQDAEACLKATEWCASDLGYFRGGGWSTDFTTKGDLPVTMFRVNLVDGLGPVLQIAEGWTIELPEKVHEQLDQRTNPTWPTTWFNPRITGKEPFQDVYNVMNAWGANHGAIAYGHVGADLITLAAMLRIPVDFHNVEEEKVFRPAVWKRFGGNDMRFADFDACRTYGPLYR
jgi:L-fucose isomerase